MIATGWRLGTALLAVGALLALTSCGSVLAPEGTSIEEAGSPGCPPPDAEGNSIIDWVEFVVVDGVSYQKVFPYVTVDKAALGPLVGTVDCTISDVGNPEYEMRDGDAAYLPAGTELRTVVGYRTDFRIAAYEDKKWHVYESYVTDGAATAGDMLDLEGKVTAIHLVEGYYGRDIEQTVDDPELVTKIVTAVLAAPFIQDDQSREATGSEEPVFVRFDLVDGTSVQRVWHVEAEVFALDFRAPAELTAAFPP